MTEIPRFPFPDGPGVLPPMHYAALRAERPLAPVILSSGSQALLVTRYDDVRTVLADPRFSRSAFPGRSFAARERESLPLAAADPPVHTRRRRAITRPLGKYTEQLIPKLEGLATQLLSTLRSVGAPTDLVKGFTRPFPMLAICQLLGVPTEDRDLLIPWVDAMMSTTRVEPELVAAAHKRMRQYFAELVDAKQSAIDRGESADDLLTELLAQQVTAGELDRAEVIALSSGLFIAGTETTGNALACCAYLLLSDQALADRLRHDPAAIPAAVEEMLRWISLNATGGVPHIATEDVPLADTVLPAGQIVIPVNDAANRDRAAFPDPDSLNIDREPHPHLAFGHGRHYCPGAQLGRDELRTGLTALLRIFPDLVLDQPPAELRWRYGMAVRGLWELPVRWSSADQPQGKGA